MITGILIALIRLHDGVQCASTFLVWLTNLQIHLHRLMKAQVQVKSDSIDVIDQYYYRRHSRMHVAEH